MKQITTTAPAPSPESEELARLKQELEAVDEALGPKPWRTDKNREPVETSRAQAITDWRHAAGAEGDEADRLREILRRYDWWLKNGTHKPHELG